MRTDAASGNRRIRFPSLMGKVTENCKANSIEQTFKVFLDLWEEPILRVIDKTQPNFMPK
ncbi:hypothetical protein OUZ56_017003 [Daphnia magna]|uniref:Uncharacterized protein n=1 Tax=Daphnia magna TaxID=35525 RepID=A0ABR0ARW3_9CRUS|nr:hypothetical protein OUZ56_017003 [Daphnia magna]